jgi:hypothetical protein
LVFIEGTKSKNAFAYIYKKYFVIDLETKWHSGNRAGNLKHLHSHMGMHVKKTLKLIGIFRQKGNLLHF